MEKQGEGSEIKSMHVADIMFLHILVFLSKEITSNEKGGKYVPLKPQKNIFLPISFSSERFPNILSPAFHISIFH